MFDCQVESSGPEDFRHDPRWPPSGSSGSSGSVVAPPGYGPVPAAHIHQRYNVPQRLEVSWLKQIVEDPRLLQGLRVMCREVQRSRLPYAPLLALNYQLGGKFKYANPED